MSNKIKIALLALIVGFLAPVNGLFAQQEMSAFTSTGRAGVSTTMVRDYQSIGINPANLGMIKNNENTLEERNVVAFGIGETVLSVHSDALAKAELRANLFSFGALQGSDTLDYEAKIGAALEFADAGMVANADVLLGGLAIQPSRKVGGFAFGVRDRFSSSFRFNVESAQVLFQGYNADYFDSLVVNSAGDTTGYATDPVTISGLFDGSRYALSWYREINLAYGRVLVDEDAFKLYAGVGAKYIMGIGYMDVSIVEQFNAFSALGPIFNVNYGGATTANPVPTGGAFTSVGNGMGFDAGITMSFVDDKIKIGASITDLGSITWKGNTYTAKDTLFNGVDANGIDSYNLIDEIEDIGANPDFFRWEGEGDQTTALPTMLRFGASIALHDMLELSTDLVMPVNDQAANIDRALFAFGVDFKPVQFLRLSTGFSSTSEYGLNIPCGIYFSVPSGVYEMGIASRDADLLFYPKQAHFVLGVGYAPFQVLSKPEENTCMISLRANAKVNIGLHITGRLESGYHTLETLYYPIFDLADILMIRAREGADCEVQMKGMDEQPDLRENLCYKAWELMAQRCERSEAGVQIVVHKDIPAGAGLGGGSSNAAAVMKALNDLWDLKIEPATLAKWAAELGADVPFFIYNQPMYGTGTGTDLRPYEIDLSAYDISLTLVKKFSSTPAAFKALDLSKVGKREPLSELLKQPVHAWRGRVENDLEGPVFAALPVVKRAKASLYRDGAAYAAMSGSGSSCFGLFLKEG